MQQQFDDALVARDFGMSKSGWKRTDTRSAVVALLCCQSSKLLLEDPACSSLRRVTLLHHPNLSLLFNIMLLCVCLCVCVVQPTPVLAKTLQDKIAAQKAAEEQATQ